MVWDESGFGMKVVLDENFWDEKRHFHPNLDESVPNPSKALASSCSILGGDHKSGFGVADWVSCRSYSSHERSKYGDGSMYSQADVRTGRNAKRGLVRA